MIFFSGYFYIVLLALLQRIEGLGEVKVKDPVVTTG
jgi:hypothetical protein